MQTKRLLSDVEKIPEALIVLMNVNQIKINTFSVHFFRLQLISIPNRPSCIPLLGTLYRLNKFDSMCLKSIAEVYCLVFSSF